METGKKNKGYLIFTLTIAILVMFSAGSGIFIDSTYAAETTAWKIQGVMQDIVDLFLVTPVLIIAGILSWRGNILSRFIFGGAVLYIAYSYVLYSFSVHYNFLFPVYCFVLGLSVYAFIFFVTSHRSIDIKHWFDETTPVKFTGYYIAGIAIGFYLLWLSINLSAIVQRTVPAGIIENGLLTNPVHALDMSVILPGFLLIAYLLLKRRPAGYLLAPVVLIFCVLMNITIAALAMAMQAEGMANSLPVVVVMGILTVISILLFYLFTNHLIKSKTKDAGNITPAFH